MNKRNIIILGAGIVGVSAARELLKRNWQVTLIDQHPIAMETSYGNCGIVSTSAAVPFNNPTLPSQLPQLMFAKNPSLSWRFIDILANSSWSIKYLLNCGYDSTLKRAHQLAPLIARGRDLHLQWMQQLGLDYHIMQRGWLKLYRTETDFRQTQTIRHLWDKLTIPYQIIDINGIAEILPSAQPIFKRGILLSDSFSIANPGEVVQAYGNQFIAEGGQFIKKRAIGLQKNHHEWQVQFNDGEEHSARHILIALGPWSPAFMKQIGISLPMAFERGAHRLFQLDNAAAQVAPQVAPQVAITDVSGGYSAALQKDNQLRITSGVYFANLHAPPPKAQLDQAEKHLRQAIAGVGKTIGNDWYGARPTMPDSMPVIGAYQNGVWIATGNQHIGLMSGPSTGECIAQLINNEKTTIQSDGFSPQRF